MPLPTDFAIPTRQQLVDRLIRDVKIRMPGAATGPGSLAAFDAANFADHLMPLYANSVRIYGNTTLADADEAGLEEKAVAKGLPKRLPASGATGFVEASIVTGGVFVDQGKVLKHDRTLLRYECTIGRTYGVDAADKYIPVRAIDTGPNTNLAAGTTLRWESPPPGLNELATVFEDADGSGLTGGRDKETVDELRARIADAEADPAVAGNVAHIRRFVKDAAAAKALPIQEVFVYPAARGPNTYAIVFTLRPESPGGSRAPTSVQRAEVLAYLRGEVSHGDGILVCTLLEEEVDIVLRVKWALAAKGWADLTTWPISADEYEVSAVTSATAFTVDSAESSPTAPQVGQRVAFFDKAKRKFVRKTIATVTSLGSGAYDLTCSTTSNASDPTYLPEVSERMCPWSESLDSLVAPILERFDGVGPGEQFDDVDLFDPGERLRRNPAPPLWSYELTHRVTGGLDDVLTVADYKVLAPALPMVTPVGTAGVSSNLFILGRLLAFPS